MIENKENVTFTASELANLEVMVEQNTAAPEDYEKLDLFLESLGLPEGYLRKQFNDQQVSSYQVFITSRTHPREFRDLRKEWKLIGIVLGAIDAIKAKVK